MFNLLFPTAKQALIKKRSSARAALLELVEKDIGNEWWYCSDCKILHPIYTMVGPTIRNYYDPFPLPPVRRLPHRHHSCYLNRRHLYGSVVVVEYPAVRLVMNRHLYGPPIGLPLEIFNVQPTTTTMAHKERPAPLPWEERWSARIRQNELLLCVNRTLNAVGWTDDALRAAIKVEGRELCGHIFTAGSTSAVIHFAIPPSTASKPVPPGPPPSPTSSSPLSPASRPFIPRDSIMDSCKFCCTDHVINIEQRRDHPSRGGKKKKKKVESGDDAIEPEPYWHISITSYHRLGRGRSHDDPVWAAFVSCQGSCRHYVRTKLRCPSGGVKAMWESEE
ncbi:hypothetical protein B0J18DRAFT_421647 [Chaetomium sp. MPI-SDFR-AT-0129]|nr:hypothetical protein B0J18DRAFT_421647 [Chaetomium sp. MPI-SDFR-AT-0129]